MSEEVEGGSAMPMPTGDQIRSLYINGMRGSYMSSAGEGWQEEFARWLARFQELEQLAD